MAEILIKNMVCPRCIMAVESSLAKQGLPYEKVELGKVTFGKVPSADEIADLEGQLTPMGFEILKDKDVQKIERVKNLLNELVQNEVPSGINLTQHITDKIPEDYTRLTTLFSSMEGITIEKYFINLKIEKAKELLFYQELTLSEMAWKLGYSSVQHLSTQFKKVTGMTPSEYKKLKDKPRTGLDKV
jgi:AraC family transcriptional regulator